MAGHGAKYRNGVSRLAGLRRAGTIRFWASGFVVMARGGKALGEWVRRNGEGGARHGSVSREGPDQSARKVLIRRVRAARGGPLDEWARRR